MRVLASSPIVESPAVRIRPERDRRCRSELLQAASAGANRQQGENDPASWLPSDLDAACEFVADWVAIKATWGLGVDEVERDAIELRLESCPERTVTVEPREPAAVSWTVG